MCLQSIYVFYTGVEIFQPVTRLEPAVTEVDDGRHKGDRGPLLHTLNPLRILFFSTVQPVLYVENHNVQDAKDANQDNYLADCNYCMGVSKVRDAKDQ